MTAEELPSTAYRNSRGRPAPQREVRTQPDMTSLYSPHHAWRGEEGRKELRTLCRRQYIVHLTHPPCDPGQCAEAEHPLLGHCTTDQPQQLCQGVSGCLRGMAECGFISNTQPEHMIATSTHPSIH